MIFRVTTRTTIVLMKLCDGQSVEGLTELGFGAQAMLGSGFLPLLLKASLLTIVTEKTNRGSNGTWFKDSSCSLCRREWL